MYYNAKYANIVLICHFLDSSNFFSPFTMTSLFSKECEFIRLSISFIFIDCTEILMAFITLMFAGHISPAHLAGVGLTNTLFNLIVVPVSAGYASVFDTYGPQVYGCKGELGTVFLKCLLQGSVGSCCF